MRTKVKKLTASKKKFHRKPIQLLFDLTDRDQLPDNESIEDHMWALCDDGTIWFWLDDSWYQHTNIPQTKD